MVHISSHTFNNVVLFRVVCAFITPYQSRKRPTQCASVDYIYICGISITKQCDTVHNTNIQCESFLKWSQIHYRHAVVNSDMEFLLIQCIGLYHRLKMPSAKGLASHTKIQPYTLHIYFVLRKKFHLQYCTETVHRPYQSL